MSADTLMPGSVSPVRTMTRRELAGYFNTPLAYIFIVVFLVLSSALTFYMASFFQQGQARLLPFFAFHPWLYLLLIPALTMRLWSEERKSGTIELLMTWPVQAWHLVLAKFLAAWLLTGLILLLTLPMAITVNLLGEPDNGVIAVQYLASWLLSGGFIAVGGFCSALSKNQVVAFIFAALACFLFLVGGTPIVLNFMAGFMPPAALDSIAGLSALSHYETMGKGLLLLRSVLYFVLLMAVFLWLTGIAIQQRKAA